MPIATCQCSFRKALSLERNHAIWFSQFILPSQANFNMNENILTYRNFTTQNKLQVCNKVLCARNLLKPLLLSLPNYCCFSYISLILLLINMTITWSYFYFFFSLAFNHFQILAELWSFLSSWLSLLHFCFIFEELFLLYVAPLYFIIFTNFYMSKRLIFPKILKLNLHLSAIQ